MMKTRILLAVCLVLAGISVAKAQRSIVALHHEGEVTFFPGSATQAAMDASVQGDTLYLSEGSFAGFNVTHGIVVLGAGENTIFSGDIFITGRGENEDAGGYVFSGLNLVDNFLINDSIVGFSMNQCQMNNFGVYSKKCLDEAVISMSCIRNELQFPYDKIDSGVYGLEILNSKIGCVVNGGHHQGAVTYFNCNIPKVDGAAGVTRTSETNNFINCIMRYAGYGTNVNCLCNGSGYATLLNCYSYADGSFNDSMILFTDEELKENGYIGTDGTVVGITGGEAPYTLELFAPHVVEHKLDVDNVSGTLTVTLKMAGDKTAEGDTEGEAE